MQRDTSSSVKKDSTSPQFYHLPGQRITLFLHEEQIKMDATSPQFYRPPGQTIEFFLHEEQVMKVQRAPSSITHQVKQ